MRSSLVTLAIAVASAVNAADSNGNGGPLGQYKAHFQNFLDRLTSYVGADSSVMQDGPVAAATASAEAKIAEIKTAHLTLDNWKETLFEPVQATSSTPEEWWVLITGRNKTCYGHCETVEKAFNETAARFAITIPSKTTPHMAILNCDEQPVLCNSWSASTGSIWAFDMLPPPAPIDIYKRRLNLTSTTSDQFVALHADGKKSFSLVDSWFHPFNGKIAELGLSVPVGYVLWAFGLVPSWALMLIVSMLSRTMLGNRMQPQQRHAAPPAAAAQ